MKFRAMFCCGGGDYDDEEEDYYDSSRRSIEIVSLFFSFVIFFSVQNEWYLIYDCLLPKKSAPRNFRREEVQIPGLTDEQ